ncbi:uncharacterized protein FIBRA_04483 [Fibroporia radiculosa]|uniref:Alpha/beta hydrolase fold-3 domain-containing protein n=1 Tax=Fibroporia radiculosa TaxID=599839 RepID=J4HWJ8_9APHY|nr:uncharacterized protein FIBRA_04483 [Fibroporia radiculosa]CCM02387.1 predicted protein [Fibroporia radiculosa]
MSQYRSLSTPDPEFAPLLAQLPTNGGVPEDITAWRELVQNVVTPALMNIRRPHLPPESKYRVRDHQIPVDGGEIAIRCVIPTPSGNEDEVFPLMLWIHGGGSITGSLDTDDFYLRDLSVDLQISIVNVDYRLAPEHPFPNGLNDCYAALKWAVENAPLLSASLAKGFIVGGQSSGANFTAVLAHRVRDDPFFADRPLSGHILQYPTIVHPEAVPEKYKSELLSTETEKDAPFFTTANIHFIARLAKAEPFNPECSPLLYPSHKGLPPAYIQVCGWDPVRDECLLYEKVLREDRVATKLDVYPGVPHAFAAMFPSISLAVKHDKDLRQAIRWLLGGAKSG